MYNVQVRAKTSAAEGRWSELVPLGKFYCDSRISMSLFKCIIPYMQVAGILKVPLTLCMSPLDLCTSE